MNGGVETYEQEEEKEQMSKEGSNEQYLSSYVTTQPKSLDKEGVKEERVSVVDVVKEMIAELAKNESSRRSIFALRDVVQRKTPRLKKAMKFAPSDLAQWINRGGPWRAFLITVTGLISVVGLTGVAAFLVFFLVATANTVIIALLGSMAAVGAIVGLFFAALTAVYIGALSVAVFVISSIAFMTIFAVVTAAGWIAFWWAIWQGVKKTVDVAKRPISYTASALQGKGQTQIAVIDGKPHALTLT